jgi:DNA-binding Lrp family transcriptional regulator
MLKPEDLKSLSDKEVRVIFTLWQPCQGGRAWRGVAELAEACNTSRETIRQTLKSLEARGFVRTERTKRNLGKLSTTLIYLTMPSAVGMAKGKEESPCQAELASTDVQVVLSTDSTSTSTTNTWIYPSDKSKRRKELVVSRRWNDDDDIAGFGLLDTEDSKPKTPVKKNTGKTRHLRPQSEWTALDVASEFTSRLMAQFPGNMTLINTKNLAIALAKNRKQYGFSSELELVLMDKWFADEKNLRNAPSRHQFLIGSFLNLFKSDVEEGYSQLGVRMPQTTPEASTAVKKLYASDGTPYDDTPLGRRFLAMHEEKLNAVRKEALDTSDK